MVEKMKTGSRYHRFVSKLLIATLSAGTFFGIQPKFIKPFGLKYVMAEPILQKSDIVNKKSAEIVKLITVLIKSPNGSDVDNAYKELKKIEEELKQVDTKIVMEIRGEVLKEIEKKYKTLFNEYKKYKNEKEPKVFGFITTIHDIRKSIWEGKKPGYPNELVNSVKAEYRRGAVPILTEKEREQKKEYNKQGIRYIEKRIEQTTEAIERIEQVANNIKDEYAKKNILSVIDSWKETANAYQEELRKIKRKEPGEIEKESLDDLGKKIDNFIKNQIVTPSEIHQALKTALFFIRALYTGTEKDIAEANKDKGILENMKQMPLKYLVCVNLVNAFIKDKAPLVYEAATAQQDIWTVIAAVRDAKNIQQEASMKKIYGQYFVEYVKGKKDILGKANEEEYEKIAKTASLLLYVNDDLMDAVVDALSKEKREEYNDEFIDAAKKIEEFIVDIENYYIGDKFNIIKLAEEQPELFSKLKENYAPIKEESLMGGLGDIVLRMNSFRQQLSLAITETNPDAAAAQLKGAFESYKNSFRDNPALLKLMYDLDTIAGHKIETVDEAKNLFSGMIDALGKQSNVELINKAIEKGVSDILVKHYIIRAYDEIAEKFGRTEGVLRVLGEAITTISQLDPYLLPQYYEKVMKPLAGVFENDQDRDFAESLATFNGFMLSRYQSERFLVEQIRNRFIEIFDYFNRGMPKAKEMMTYHELEYETRQRGELDQYEVFPPHNLYGLKESELLRMTNIQLPYIQRYPALDILPHPQLPTVASLPQGQFIVDANAQGLYEKLTLQLNPFRPAIGRVGISTDFRIARVSRNAVLQHIRKTFGQISMYAPTDLISAMTEFGAFAAAEEQGTKAGAMGEAQLRYPEGGLSGRVTYLTEAAGEEWHEVTAQTAGGGAGPIIHFENTIRLTKEEGETFSKTALNAMLKNLVALSKQTGQSILLYVPELSYYKEETTVSEEQKRVGGKIYYINPNGDAYQLSVGANDLDAFKNFIYGSAETENVLASIRKYGWNEGDFADFGGAFGFTLGPVAAFAMEDAINRISTIVSPTLKKDEITGLEVKEINMKKLNPVAYSGAFAMAFNDALFEGTLAFITRITVPTEIETTRVPISIETEKAGVPPKKIEIGGLPARIEGAAEGKPSRIKFPEIEMAGGYRPYSESKKVKPAPEKGVYNLEIIWRKIEPAKETEIRAIGGYPPTAGISFNQIVKEGEITKGVYLKGAVATTLFWENLYQQEAEADAIANYVSTKLAEAYYWTEDKTNQERNFIGFSLMFSSLNEQKEGYKKLMKDFGWDSTYFSVVAAHYARKYGVYIVGQRLPGFANNLEQISDIIEQGRIEAQAYPEWADEINKRIANQIERMKDQKIWRGVAGLELNFDTWEAGVLGRAEIPQYEKRPELGYYSIIEGVVFAGHKEWVKPFFQANLLSYHYAAQQGYANYLDLLLSAGAAELAKLSSSKTFEYEIAIKSKEDLREHLEDNQEIIKGVLTYLTGEKTKEKFEFDFGDNAKTAGLQKQKRYYLLVNRETKKCYIGNEDDRKKWLELGYDATGIYQLDIEDNRITLTVPNISESRWFKAFKLVGGIPLKVEKEGGAKVVGWTAGLLVDVFQNYKTDIIAALLAGRKELEGYDLSQYAFVLSSKWDEVNFGELGQRVYGYIIIDHINRKITMAPEKEIETTTFGAGLTFAYFDGLLGETRRLNIYAEAGWENAASYPKNMIDEYTTLEKIKFGSEMIFRAGVTYEWKQTFFGDERWLNIGVAGWRGWWPPLAQPLNVADFTTLPQHIYYDVNRPLGSSLPWAFMLYFGLRW